MNTEIYKQRQNDRQKKRQNDRQKQRQNDRQKQRQNDRQKKRFSNEKQLAKHHDRLQAENTSTTKQTCMDEQCFVPIA